MMRRTLELARVGVHGVGGKRVTEQDLKEIVETFPGSAPITIGHELADWMPAFGKVTRVKYDPKTGTLSGTTEVSDVLAEAWEAGLYDAWSIGAPRRATDGKRTLHHLAFLGAVPPAVKGLKVLQAVNLADVAAEDSITNTTEEGPMKKTAEQLEAELAQEKQAREAAELRAKTAEDKLEAAGETELSDVERENVDLKQRLAAGKKQALLGAARGKVPKAREADLVALADAVAGGKTDTIELADSDGKKETVSALELLTRIFSAMATPVREGELDLGDGQPAPGAKSVFEGLSRFA